MKLSKPSLLEAILLEPSTCVIIVSVYVSLAGLTRETMHMYAYLIIIIIILVNIINCLQMSKHNCYSIIMPMDACHMYDNEL